MRTEKNNYKTWKKYINQAFLQTVICDGEMKYF